MSFRDSASVTELFGLDKFNVFLQATKKFTRLKSTLADLKKSSGPLTFGSHTFLTLENKFADAHTCMNSRLHPLLPLEVYSNQQST